MEEAADTNTEETTAEDTETASTEDADTLVGTEGVDTIEGTEGADKFDGRDGDDTIFGLGGSDEIDGGTGADKLYGVDDKRAPDDGDDEIRGGFGDDTIFGGPGADTLEGEEGNDTVYAGPYDSDVDAVEGGEGDNTLLTADLPASRDVVGCGAGTDEVVADSLDEVADDCEDVEKMQETEPNIADGTYELVPAPSSECSLGKGTLTVGVDPATGQRGVGVQFEERQAPQGAVEACGPRIDYETPVTEQGEPAAQETGRRSYKGKKPSQQEIDEVMKGAQNGQEEPAIPAEP